MGREHMIEFVLVRDVTCLVVVSCRYSVISGEWSCCFGQCDDVFVFGGGETVHAHRKKAHSQWEASG